MKKLLIATLISLSCSLYAFSLKDAKAAFEKEFATEINDAKELINEFKKIKPSEEELEVIDWAKYELECIKEDVVPAYSEYLKLVPQCYGDEVEELNKIMKGE